MKKILAALLTVLCVVSVFAFTACNGLEDLENMIENEETWNKAFEEIDYVNFSAHVKIIYKDDEEDNYVDNYVKVSEDGLYYNVADYNVFYTVKCEDGTFSTYKKRVKHYENPEGNFVEEEYYEKLKDNTDNYYINARREAVIEISFANYFDMFTFDKETGMYLCQEEIKATSYNFDGEVIDKPMYCFNIEIKTESNKIIYIKCNYKSDDEDDEMVYSLEYYDIGKTKVTVPEDIINNAVDET